MSGPGAGAPGIKNTVAGVFRNDGLFAVYTPRLHTQPYFARYVEPVMLSPLSAIKACICRGNCL